MCIHTIYIHTIYLFTITYRTKQALSEVLVDPVINEDEILSKGYVLMAGDIRNIDSLGERMLAAGLDKSLPTMFLTECVLVYIEPEKSCKVIEWAGTTFGTTLFLNYEPVSCYCGQAGKQD